MLDRIHRGHGVVEQMHTTENGKAIEIPDGLVHDWLAIDQVVALAQDYFRYVQLYGPDVQQAHVISQAGSTTRSITCFTGKLSSRWCTTRNSAWTITCRTVSAATASRGPFASPKCKAQVNRTKKRCRWEMTMGICGD